MSHNLFFSEIIGYIQKASSLFLKMKKYGKNVPNFTFMCSK